MTSTDGQEFGMSEFAGLHRQFEIGMRFAPTRAGAANAAKSVAALIDEHPDVGVRLVDLSSTGSRVHFTVAVCLGTIDEIKTSEPAARSAIALLQRFVDTFGPYDPAFVQLPQHGSAVDDDLRELLAVG